MKKTPPDSPKTTQDSANSDSSTEQSERTRKSRRKLIQLLATGGVVTSAKVIPTDWAKPVVETVALPAHAQTTEEDSGPGTCRLGVYLWANEPDFGAAVRKEIYRPTDDLSPTIVEKLKELGEDVLGEFASEALAFDGPPRICERFTGCFWIEFKCNSKSGMLCFTYFDDKIEEDDLDGDGITEDGDSGPGVDVRTECVPFGEDGSAEYDGVDFLVEIVNRDLAKLTIRGCCGGDVSNDLTRGFKCPDPYSGDQTPMGIPCPR